MRTRPVFVCTLTLAGILFASEVFEGQRLRPGTLGVRGPQLPIGLVCFHDSQSSLENQARRAAAQTLARTINEAQSRAVSAAGRYVALAELPQLPPVPDGFDLRFYTDGNGYVVSLKDTRDPCRYGLFSDQQNRIYESSPQVPQLAS